MRRKVRAVFKFTLFIRYLRSSKINRLTLWNISFSRPLHFTYLTIVYICFTKLFVLSIEALQKVMLVNIALKTIRTGMSPITQ